VAQVSLQATACEPAHGTPEHSNLELLLIGNSFGKPYRVVIHGLPHFCGKLAALLNGDGWDVRFHSGSTPRELFALANDLRRCDLAYTWGGRIDLGKFLWAARCLGVQNLVMLWSGSDVLWAQKDFAAGKMHPWVASKIHWGVSPWVAEEVRSIGLECEYFQASFVQPVKDLAAMPEKFSVLAYIPSVDKTGLYGWQQILEVAKALPSVKFNVVGLQGGETLQAPGNVSVQGWTKDLATVLRKSAVLWRPVQHDGLSFMVLEALAQGRHVLYSYPLRGCTQVKDAVASTNELRRLVSLHESRSLGLNAAGLEAVDREFSAARVRESLLRSWEQIILSSGAAPRRDFAKRSAADSA